MADLTQHKGYPMARDITHHHAKTFYFASLFLPKSTRPATYAIYTICRFSDDSVDQSTKDKAQNVANMQKQIDLAYSRNTPDDPVLSLFQQTVNQYQIPKKYFDDLIHGIEMDLEKNRYETFDELYKYCYHVAGVVGLIMVYVFGFTDDRALDHAVELGIAMQLTNILRDVREDLEMNRIYLPREELERFNIHEEDLRQQKISEDFINLYQFQIARARKYYTNSSKGLPFLKNRRSRYVVNLMKVLYAGILQEIEKNKFDVFSHRAHVSGFGKVCVASRLLLSGSYM